MSRRQTLRVTPTMITATMQRPTIKAEEIWRKELRFFWAMGLGGELGRFFRAVHQLAQRRLAIRADRFVFIEIDFFGEIGFPVAHGFRQLYIQGPQLAFINLLQLPDQGSAVPPNGSRS